MWINDNLDVTVNKSINNNPENKLADNSENVNKQSDIVQLPPPKYADSIEPQPSCSKLPAKISTAVPSPIAQHCTNLDSSIPDLDSIESSCTTDLNMADKNSERVDQANYQFQIHFGLISPPPSPSAPTPPTAPSSPRTAPVPRIQGTPNKERRQKLFIS